MRRYKLVLTSHENFSIRVDGLVSILYLDVSTSGLILNCYKALANANVFATGEVEQLLFDDSIPSALVIQFIELDEHFNLNAHPAFAQNTLPIKVTDPNHLVLSGSIPAMDVFINLLSKRDTLAIGTMFDESLWAMIQNLKAEMSMVISSSASAFNSATMDALDEVIRFIDHGNLTITVNASAKQSGMQLSTNSAETKSYAPYYMSEWVDFEMEDLEDMTMDEMMYGEVIE